MLPSTDEATGGGQRLAYHNGVTSLTVAQLLNSLPLM